MRQELFQKQPLALAGIKLIQFVIETVSDDYIVVLCVPVCVHMSSWWYLREESLILKDSSVYMILL